MNSYRDVFILNSVACISVRVLSDSLKPEKNPVYWCRSWRNIVLRSPGPIKEIYIL